MYRNILAVMRVEFISDRKPYIILRGRWCDMTILSAHTSRGDKTDDTKNSYEALERVFDKFQTKILIGDCSAKVGGEDILIATAGNKRLHEITHGNNVRVVKSTC
jgi:hypothetical protein